MYYVFVFGFAFNFCFENDLTFKNVRKYSSFLCLVCLYNRSHVRVAKCANNDSNSPDVEVNN